MVLTLDVKGVIMQSHSGPANTTNAQILAALEAAWAEAQGHHPELPAVRLVLASGSERGQYKRRGYHHAKQWKVGGSDLLAEVMIAGERLADGADQVLCTLLHEGAHALADVRGVQETSRQNRYHNATFRALAEELGCVVVTCKQIGHRTTGLQAWAADRYAGTVAALEAAIAGAHRIKPGVASVAVQGGQEGTDGGEAKPPRVKWLKGSCDCEEGSLEVKAKPDAEGNLPTLECFECSAQIVWG